MSSRKCLICHNTFQYPIPAEVKMCPKHFNIYVVNNLAGRTSYGGRVIRIEDDPKPTA